jgi:hypothetical protein
MLPETIGRTVERPRVIRTIRHDACRFARDHREPVSESIPTISDTATAAPISQRRQRIASQRHREPLRLAQHAGVRSPASVCLDATGTVVVAAGHDWVVNPEGDLE